MKKLCASSLVATCYFVSLPSGDWVRYSMGRPVVCPDKPRQGFDHIEDAEAFASQLGGSVSAEQYEYFNA